MSHYGTLPDALAYHESRGNTAWAALADDTTREQALRRATDYIDRVFMYQRKSLRYVSMFAGSKTNVNQEREFPRDSIVTMNGDTLDDNTTPLGVEQATYEAALLEAETPGTLSPTFTPSTQQGPVTQETVGPLTIKYDGISSDMEGYKQRPPNMPVVFAVERLVAPFLKAVAYCEPTVKVV